MVVFESTCSRSRNPLYTTKEFFKADLSTNTTHLHDGVIYYYDHNPFRIFLSCFFF